MKNMRRAAAAVAISSAALLGAAMLVPTVASAAAPAAPTGLTPNDTSDRQYKNLELRWAPVAGATGYQIEVSDDGDFDRATSLAATSVAPRWTPPTTLPFGDYAWRVRSTSPTGNSQWREGNFTRGWSGAPASPNVVVEPGSQATNFSWGAIPDASFYEVQVVPARRDGTNPWEGTEPDGASGGTASQHWTCYTSHAAFSPYASAKPEENVPGDESGCFTGTSKDPEPTANITVTLSGRTATLDASTSKAGGRSPLVSYRFTFGDGEPAIRTNRPVVSHLYPAAKSEYNVTVTVYNAAGGASKPVKAKISVDPDAGTPVGEPIEGTESEEQDDIALGQSLTPWTYFWRVRGRDDTVDASKSGFAEAPYACGGVWYESFSRRKFDQNGFTTGYTVPLVPAAPTDAKTPECSAWSSTGSFTINSNPTEEGNAPGVVSDLRIEPTQGDPRAAVVPLTDTPMFRWDRADGTMKYRVYVSRTADFRNPDRVYETHSTSLMPVGTYQDRTLKTYWTVQACTGAKACGPIATLGGKPQSFTKDAKVNVRDAETDVDGKYATLSWDTQFNPTVAAGQGVPLATEAKAYQLQVALEGDWSKPALDVKTDRVADSTEVGVARHTADISTLADGLYTWRVRPIDQADRLLKWSRDTGSFLRDTAAPSLTLATKSGFGGKAPLTLTTSEPVIGASAATIRVVAGSTKAGVPGVLTPTGQLSYSFVPRDPWVAGETYTATVAPSVQDRAKKRTSVTAVIVRANGTVDSASPALRRTVGDFGWGSKTASDAMGKSYVVSSDKPATKKQSVLTTKVRGSVVTVNACKSPTSGRLGIRIDGKAVATVDLYRHFSGCQVVWKSKRLKDGQHTVQLVPTGTRNKASKGTLTGVDAIRVR